MIHHQQLKVTSSVTLEYTAPIDLRWGYPDSVGFILYDDANSQLFSGSCSSVGLSASFSDGTQQGKTITVADSSDAIVGLQHCVRNNVSNRVEGYRIVDTTSTTVTVDRPLSVAIPIGSIIPSVFSVTLDADSIGGDTIRDCRGVWEVNYSRVGTKEFTQVFDIVEDPFSLDLTMNDIVSSDPAVGSMINTDADYGLMIDQAINETWAWLLNKQVKPDLIRNRNTIKTAAALKFLEIFHQQSSQLVNSGPALSETYRDKFEQYLGSFMSSEYWYDFNDDLSKYDNEDNEGRDSWGTDNVDESKGAPGKWFKVTS